MFLFDHAGILNSLLAPFATKYSAGINVKILSHLKGELIKLVMPLSTLSCWSSNVSLYTNQLCASNLFQSK